MTGLDGVSRRAVLAVAGTTLGAAAYAELLGPMAAAQEAPDAVPRAGTPVTKYTVVVRRPSDQCVLTLTFWNATPSFAVTPPVMRRVNPNSTSYLVVEFGAPGAHAPMHMAEHAYPLATGNLTASSQTHAPTPPPTTTAVHAPPVGAQLSGPSRLVFHVPNEMLAQGAEHPITLDTAGLLDWLGLSLSVSANAVPPFQTSAREPHPAGIGAPKAPSLLQTAIELPYRLVLSPPAVPTLGSTTKKSVFVNATGPVTHKGWTELWHTRLAVGATDGDEQDVDETTRALRTVRAIWCTDPGFAAHVANNSSPGDGQPGFTNSLEYPDRYDIVRLTSDFTASTKGGPFGRLGKSSSGLQLTHGFIPAPATVDRLMLSALGGWLDCDAHWDLPHAVTSSAKPRYNSSLLSWRHRAVQARDAYVRVVRKGYLFPWGHRASLITVTEREPTITGNTVGAYLRQKTFIVIGEPSKTYGGTGDFVPNAGRKIPFTKVDAVTLITPDLAAPAYYLTAAQQNHNKKLVFQPTVGSGPYLFHFRGTDWAGDPIDVRSPVLWIDDTVAYGDGANATLMNKVIAKWRSDYPSLDLHNQRVSVAKPKSPAQVTGDTQVVIASFELGVDLPATGTTPAQLVGASQPNFYPNLHTLSVNMPAAATASGTAIGASKLEFDAKNFLAGGFGSKNPGGVFLRRVASAPQQAITFKGDKSGAAITPNLGIDGYSRELGPTSGDVDLLAAGTFDPKQVFAGVNAKLLGGLELSAILGLVGFGAADPNGNAQALQLTSVEQSDPHRIVTTLDWHPVIVNGGPTIAGHQFLVFEVRDSDGSYPVSSASNAAKAPGSSTSMDLHAVVVTDLDTPGNSTTTVNGQIRDFNINLFGDESPLFFIQLPFDSLSFRAQSGKKTDVQVQISDGGVQFKGALSFVQDLADYLSFGGSGLVIDTSGDAIKATLTLAIPTISVGAFSLSHLAFSAGVAIPYNGDPVRFMFAFCSRDNPFQLDIMMFSGGGFVGLGIGVDGVELLEFSFDFGLGISIDVGVASGEVSLVGGVYYESAKLNGTQHVELTAYVKASGGISCLGLISISVELYLALEYTSPPSKLVGEASMSIAVHIIFFGFSVGFDVRKEFAGPDDGGSSAAARVGSRRSRASAAPQLASAYPDNSFGAAMSDTDWAEYCTSFALVGVAGS